MFFKEIEKQLTEGVPMHISVMKKNGKLTVITTLLDVIPLSIVASAEQLDAEYFKILATPIELAKGLKTNATEVVESIKETIKEESKPKVEKKAVVAKAPVKTKTLKEAIADGDKLFEEKKYQEAVDLFDNLFMNNPENKLLPVKLQKAKQWLKATTEADIFTSVDKPAHKSEAMNAAGKAEHARQEAAQTNVDLDTFVEEPEEEKEVEAPVFDDEQLAADKAEEDALMIQAVKANGGLDGNEFDFEIPTM